MNKGMNETVNEWMTRNIGKGARCAIQSGGPCRAHWQTALPALYFAAQPHSLTLVELLYSDTHVLFVNTCLHEYPCKTHQFTKKQFSIPDGFFKPRAELQL